MYFTNYLDKTMNDNDEYTIHIDSFNNKGQKGDDDFETWLETEAPLLGDTTLSIVDNASMYNTCATACTSTITGLSPTFTIKDSPHFAPTKQKKLPIDILHKWYPEQMKDIDDEDVPF